MKTLSNVLATGAVAAALSFGGAAQAATIVFDFTNTTLSDGGSLTGSFTYNSTTNTYTNWNFTTGVGTAVTSAFNYTNASATIQGGTDGNTFNLSNGTTRSLALEFAALLSSVTAVGNTITITPSSGPFFNTPSNELALLPGQGSQFRGVTGGIITVSQFTPDPVGTPEPGTVLAVLAVAGAGALARRKK